MNSKENVEKNSAGGVWQGFPYEQILDDNEEATFLVYRKTPILDKLRDKTGDWKTYYMAESYLDDSETGVRLIPMKRVPWDLAGFFPEERLDHTALWNAVKGFLIDHLDFPDKLIYDVLVGWIFSTYVLKRWQSVPYLFFLGPVKSGKTRALECLQQLCYRGVLAANISGPALYRLIEVYTPTILLDETEIYNSEARSEIIGLLNSGYRRGQYAIRASTGQDVKPEPVYYKVFGFKAMAGTRGHKETLESRSIVISMYKATRKVRLFLDRETAKQLRMQLLLWRLEQFDAVDAVDAIDALQEKLPLADGRFLEKYYPLISVANAGRTQILEYARKALELEQYADEATVEAEVTQVLRDCHPNVDNGVLKNRDIVERFNLNKDDREKWKTRTITSVVRRLGFHPKRARNGDRGYFYDTKILDGLSRRYGLSTEPLDDTPSPGASITSITSNPSMVKDRIIYNINEDRCSICRKVPEQLYPDANAEYLICETCKRREGEPRR